MSNHHEKDEVITHESTENGAKQELQKFFLTDESFDLLRKAQQRIREVTELTPSLRKMINELVNSETVEKLVLRLIEELK